MHSSHFETSSQYFSQKFWNRRQIEKCAKLQRSRRSNCKKVLTYIT